MADRSPRGEETRGKIKPARIKAAAATGAPLRAVNPQVKPPLLHSSASLRMSQGPDVQEMAAPCSLPHHGGA